MFSLLNINIIITLFCWSVWGIIDKKALEHSTSIGVMVRLYANNAWQIPLLWLYLLFTQPHFEISSAVWMWTGVAALFQLFALASYMVAMTLTDASLVLASTAAYPVVTQFLAFIFLGERLSLLRTLGSLGIALGVIGIGMSFEHSEKKLSKRQTILLAVCVFLATFGWGIWGIFDKKAIESGTPMAVWLAESLWECVLMLLAVGIARVAKYPIEIRDKKAWVYTSTSAIALGLGRLTFLFALNAANASYVIAITGCYPLFMYFLALIFLKEKFSKLRLAGIFFIVAGGTAVQWSV